MSTKQEKVHKMSTENQPWPAKWVRERRFQEWFEWIGSLFLTAGLFAVAHQVDWFVQKLVLNLLALISVFFIYFWTFAWLIRSVEGRLPRLKVPRAVANFLAAIISFPLTVGLMFILGLAIAGLLTGN